MFSLKRCKNYFTKLVTYTRTHHTVLESCRCFTFDATCYTKLVEQECCISWHNFYVFFFTFLLADYARKTSLTATKTKHLLMRSLFCSSYGSVKINYPSVKREGEKKKRKSND